MKTLNFEQMENLQGGIDTSGWTWSPETHFWCAITGVLAGGGIVGAAGYIVCLELAPTQHG